MGNSTSSADSDEEIVINQRAEACVVGTVEHDRETVPMLDLSLLFDITSLRNMAAKIPEEIPENVLQQHQEHLIRWLEELHCNQETVTMSQFYDVLYSRSVDRSICRKVFQQFDCEGDGLVDVKTLLDFLKKYNGSVHLVDLDCVIRTFQSCLYTPGFLDIYNEDKECVGHHASCLLRFVIKNRAVVSTLPYLTLNNFNNVVNMRLSVLRNHFNKLKQTSVSSQKEDEMASSSDRTELFPISKCIASYEVSSNKSEAHRLFSSESSYWQSDGSARSHWIRLRMKSNIVIKQLSIGVASTDQSYMPQLVVVFVGRDLNDLHELKETKVPAHLTGDVVLLENAKVHYPIVQINVRRCHSDGCDTRIHCMKMLGYRPAKEQGITTMDAASGWLLQVLSDTAMACLPFVPNLRNNILGHARNALGFMPPLSLSPAGGERPPCISLHVLKEVDTFLLKMAGGHEGELLKDGLDVLLSFSLAQGHLASALKTLMLIKEAQIEEMQIGKLLHSMNTVINAFWKKHGQQLHMVVVGCDGGQKDNTSAPSNVLNTPWVTSQPYLSGDGRVKVNMFFMCPHHIQLTKLRIKVDRGDKGPKNGMVFVYNHKGEFNLEEHVKRFEFADSWRQTEYNAMNHLRETGMSDNLDNPVAYFSVTDDWDEVEVNVDVIPVGQYVLVKFLEPRFANAERLSIVGVKFFGFNRKDSQMGNLYDILGTSTRNQPMASCQCIIQQALAFFVSLARDQVKSTTHNSLQALNMAELSMSILWDFYSTIKNSPIEAGLLLQLLHALIPHLTTLPAKDQDATEAFFKHLCELVDSEKPTDDDSVAGRHLLQMAKEVITDGAALFFPDKEARNRKLFCLIKDISDTNEAPSVTLTFQSLCQFFSNVDPSALLDLPTSPSQDFDTSQVLRVMSTLVSVAHRECLAFMQTEMQSEKLSHLVRLLCSLQTNLLNWCCTQMESDDKHLAESAETVIKKYVSLTCAKVTSALESYTECDVSQMAILMDKLKVSFLYSAFSQLILILTHLCKFLECKKKVSLLDGLMPVVNQLHRISLKLPQFFHKADSSYWQSMEQAEEVLKVWEVESSHNYENNLSTVQVFSCPGASTFLVEFDPRCETEKRYDYLEFTDARGNKKKYDQKVNTEKWPLHVSFVGGSHLQFVFRSDGSNNEWGYKFKVTAKGNSDISMCWMFDLYLNLSKLIGEICGSCLDNTKVFPKCDFHEGKEEFELEFLQSDLWTTLFRSGYQSSCLKINSFDIQYRDMSESDGLSSGVFILNLLDCNNEDAKSFHSQCKEHHFGSGQNLFVGSPAVHDAILHVFCALLWHTQMLREDIDKYVKDGENAKVSEGILQAYSMADSLRRSFMTAERTREKVSSGEGSKSYDALATVKEKSLFLLRFPGMTKLQAKLETKPKNDRKMMKLYNRMPSFNNDKSLKTQAETVLDKYPSFRLVLDFIQDPAWSTERVEHLLLERSQQAEMTAKVFNCLVKFLEIVSDSSTNIFQIPVVLLFQELLKYQEKFPHHYASGLDGCGLELEEKVRNTYYDFIRYMIKAIDIALTTGRHRHVHCYDFVEVATLHFLDMKWQLCDLPFLEELKLPDLYYQLVIASLMVREEVPEPVEEDAEMEEYKILMSWLEECRKLGFNPWHDKHKKDDKKMVQSFIARYSDVLEEEMCCAVCGTTLPGGRYRCLECADVNLCATCYADGIVAVDGHSVDHGLMHFLYRCDGCQGFIVGTRIHCNVCDDFDLCLGCQKSSRYPTEKHKPEHSFSLHPPKKLALIKETYSPLKSYMHCHAWLLYSSLALSTATILYSRHQDPVIDSIQSAVQLYNRFIQILTRCCMQTPISTLSVTDTNKEDSLLRTMQEETFVHHSQERIMGLLGAMIPGRDKGPFAEDVSQTIVSEEFLNILFSIARDETGRDSNLQHFALGLIGQLLQRIPICCKLVDLSLGLSSDSVESESTQRDETVPEGFKAIQHLFHIGASCLDRNGLEWANMMATILQKLFLSPSWQDPVQMYLENSLAKLRKGHSLSSVFALYVVAGFPEVLSLGSLVKYTDPGTEQKFGIVMKHFAEKNRTLVVDRLTRHRQTLKDVSIEVVSFNNCFVGEENIVTFADVIQDLVGKMKNSESLPVETTWVLYLVLKALLKVTRIQRSPEEKSTRLFEPEFIQCVVHLAGLGTGFSKQWLISDLEILSVMLYTKDDHKKPSTVSVSDTSEPLNQTEQMATSSSDDSTCDPLDELTPLARQTFNTLHTNLHVPLPVLRAVYEMHGCSTDALILAIHENLRNESYTPSEDVLKAAKKWEDPGGEGGGGGRPSMQLEIDKAIDIGLQSMSVTYVKENKEFDGRATEEPVNECQRLITTVDSNLQASANRQRHRNSTILLRRELEKDRSDSPTDFLKKVNVALSVLYARQVLTALLADKSTSRHVITTDLIGCQMETDIPYVLDLLNRPESQEMFHMMVENVIQHCKPDGLASVATISCDFMEEISLMTVVKENNADLCESSATIQEKIHIPGTLCLCIQFDSRCYTDDSEVKLIFSSSPDFKQDKRVFSGPNYRRQWTNLEIPGDTVYFKLVTDASSCWSYKFTVVGSRSGRFDTGYRILNGLLNTSSIVHRLPLNKIWCSLIRVSCKQIGQRRLKSVQLLLLLLQSQFKDNGCTSQSLELGLLCPLWRLHRKMSDSFQDSVCILSPLVRALTELFFSSENLAMEWEITDEYAASLLDDEDIRHIMLQGLENVAALSYSINYRNKATDAFKTTNSLAPSLDKSKFSRSPKCVINV